MNETFLNEGELVDDGLVDAALELLEKENAGLDPELMTGAAARKLLSTYVKVGRAAAFGIAALSRKVNDTEEMARLTGTSMGQARTLQATGEVLARSDDLSNALQQGAVSLEQATEIASAEESCPGSAGELVAVAQEQPFHVLKDKARKTKLEAEQQRGLGERQRDARDARSYVDPLGMMNIHLRLQPHVGVPLVARAEADAQRLARAARKEGDNDTGFAQHLADAYAEMLAGGGKGRAKRPELVILVSHEVAQRGWRDVRAGEVCKIPGVGPIPPDVAKEIARDAFLSGVIYDG
ncbi:MAG: hypothetical protein QOH90_1967, partial [Actinomycetota bacterium]|nr:hypothetical protein [Actinomycetota bacterium]